MFYSAPYCMEQFLMKLYCRKIDTDAPVFNTKTPKADAPPLSDKGVFALLWEEIKKGVSAPKPASPNERNGIIFH